ncbi:MAG: hypothetical protein WA005_09705, partial [Candidatus Binataceae bacterium]
TIACRASAAIAARGAKSRASARAASAAHANTRVDREDDETRVAVSMTALLTAAAREEKPV